MADFGTLSITLSRRLRDPVSAFATDGNVWSSSLRSDYLNKGMNELQRMIFATHGVERTWKILQGQVNTQTLTLAGAGISLDSTYGGIPLGVHKTSTKETYEFSGSQHDVLSNANAFQSNKFVVTGGSIYVYEKATIPSTGTATFYFIRTDTHTVDEAVYLSDNLFDTLVDMAAAYALQDHETRFAESKQFFDRVAAFIKGL